MFTIIGGDGKEYGPVTVDQIRAWITSGRANLDTQAKALGTDEWRRVGDFAEFGKRAETIRMTRCEIQQVEAQRRSGSTGQTHSLGGFVGDAEYEGD